MAPPAAVPVVLRLWVTQRELRQVVLPVVLRWWTSWAAKVPIEVPALVPVAAAAVPFAAPGCLLVQGVALGPVLFRGPLEGWLVLRPLSLLVSPAVCVATV